MNKYTATLIRVIDGDTLDAEIEVGFDIFVRKRIRLWGINAPESRSIDEGEVRLAELAKSRLEGLIQASNGVFTLLTHGDGKYGRCLGEIFVEHVSGSVNQALIKEGLARKYEK